MNNGLLPSYQSELIEAGCDEAGRGCLAGPVFAAAVILPKDYFHPILNDSKKLNEATRKLLRKDIESAAISYAVAKIDAPEIDKINILNASIKAMHQALNLLKIRPEFIIVDGNRFKPHKQIEHKTIIKGDGIYFNIAAASILAKTYRDDYMLQMHKKYNQYNWQQNKGYPTLQHKQLIQKYGLCALHRKTFNHSIKAKTLFDE